MKKKQQLLSGVADAARAVLVVRADDPEVRRHIAGLLNSLHDILSYDQVLEELKALTAGQPPSAELLLITRQFVNKETRHRQGIVGSIRGMKKGPIAQRARLASIRQRLFRLFNDAGNLHQKPGTFTRKFRSRFVGVFINAGLYRAIAKLGRRGAK
jgi:hypothetical protein